MARKPRLEFPGAFYHVVTRGNNRQSIFFSNKDRLELLDRIKDYIIEFKFNLYAYVFMMNHIHLLIETSPGFVKDDATSINQLYSIFQSEI